MTWEELKQKAIKTDGIYVWFGSSEEYISLGNIYFHKDGTIECGDWCDRFIIATDRTPDQMWQIMEALQ